MESFDSYQEYLKWCRHLTPLSEEQFYRSVRYTPNAMCPDRTSNQRNNLTQPNKIRKSVRESVLLDIREGARRQHRKIAIFCIAQCWLRGLDGIEITREDLQRLLGLEKFKQSRIDWIEQDFRDFFVFSKVHRESYVNPQGITSYYQDIFSGISLSRVPFYASPKIEKLNLWKTIDTNHTPSLDESLYPFFSLEGNYDERLLTSYLSLLSQGQIAPKYI